MDAAERIEKLTGEMAALTAFCVAVIGTHPDRAALSQRFAALAETLTARSLAMPVPEQRLQGMRDLVTRLQEAAGHFDKGSSTS